MKILFYCPDRHIQYEGAAPDVTGVGGGVTARIRMAAALAGRGHEVTLIGNVPRPHRYEGVRYVPLGQWPGIAADVLVVHTSGGAVDIGETAVLPIEPRVRVLLLSGSIYPKGAADQHFDAIYSPSNFIARAVRAQWPIRDVPVFVSDCGTIRAPLLYRLLTHRHPKRMIYTSHPSKGLDAAIRLMRLLRESDPGYQLHVFGGDALWGTADRPPNPEPGLFYRGLVGQRQMAREYPRAGFAIHLQSREEPFGISLVEAMAAGCIVIASPTGSFTGLVKHEADGYLVPGDPAEESTLRLAKQFMLRQQSGLRRAAMKVPFSWATLAGVWEAHFQLLLGDRHDQPARAVCRECGEKAIVLADGTHCLVCSHYARGPGGF
ncbi:MAG: glycosyltransferase family 4 protein [Terriglobia bacterium]